MYVRMRIISIRIAIYGYIRSYISGHGFKSERDIYIALLYTRIIKNLKFKKEVGIDYIYKK